MRCLERWERGTYSFRLFFNGIPNWFEYAHLGEYISAADEIEVVKSNLRIDSAKTITEVKTVNVKPADKEEYLPRLQPIFTVKGTNSYDLYSLPSFRTHPGYSIVVDRLNQHFGRFDEKWISKIQYRLDSDIHYFQLQVRFLPFLVDVDFEAHYYGSTNKASLLQIDEKIFDARSDKAYLDNWSEIKDFNSYRAFKEANQYVLS